MSIIFRLFLGIFLLSSSGFAFYNSKYISISNQVARSKQLIIVSNNIANISTKGYIEENAIMSVSSPRNNPRNSFVQLKSAWQNKAKGPIKHTGRDLDVTLETDGYFILGDINNLRYSSNASMIVNSENILVDINSHLPILDDNLTEIILPENAKSLATDRSGNIYVDQIPIAKFGVIQFADSSKMLKMGTGLYSTKEEGVVLDEYVSIPQALRESNVNTIHATQNMIELQRASESTRAVGSNMDEAEKGLLRVLTSK